MIELFTFSSIEAKFIENSKKVVCQEKRRPEQNLQSTDSHALSLLNRIQSECWDENPQARLPILRVNKYLKQCQDITAQIYNDNNLGIFRTFSIVTDDNYIFTKKFIDTEKEIHALIESVPIRHQKREEEILREQKRIKEERALQLELEQKRTRELLPLPALSGCIFICFRRTISYVVYVGSIHEPLTYSSLSWSGSRVLYSRLSHATYRTPYSTFPSLSSPSE